MIVVQEEVVVGLSEVKDSLEQALSVLDAMVGDLSPVLRRKMGAYLEGVLETVQLLDENVGENLALLAAEI